MKNNIREIFESGFSLLQVMLSIALTAGLSLTLLQLSQNQAKQQKTIELKGELADIVNIIRESLRDRVACEMTFAETYPGGKIDELRVSEDMSQPPFAVIGQKFKNYNVYIKDMRLLTRPEEIDYGKRQVGQTPMNYTDGLGYGYLKINFIKHIGDINQTDLKQNFFGGKETQVIFAIKGYFYDEVNISGYDTNDMTNRCQQLAMVDGVTCNFTSLNQPCRFVEDPPPYSSDGQSKKLMTGTCFYYRDSSPLRRCFYEME
jgi:hypothetical protein